MKQNVRTATEVDVFVGAQLKALRKSAGLSQTELANQIGVTFQQVQKYERGTNRIGASRLWGFCKVFNVKPSRFFDGVETHVSGAKTPDHAKQDHANRNSKPSSYQRPAPAYQTRPNLRQIS